MIGSVDPTSLDGLGRLSGLEVLIAYGAPPPESEDETIARLPAAKTVDLAFLDAMPRLRELSIGFMRVDDAGLAHIARHERLKILSIEAPDVTDAGLAHLAGLKSLRLLDLGSAIRITDAGLAHLVGLAELDELVLSKARLTGPGLNSLLRLSKLRLLTLCGARLDPSALVAFKAARPGLSVSIEN